MSKNRKRKQRSQNEMKQTPQKDSSETQVNNAVCVSSESSENTSVEDKSISAKDGIIKPIVDRFDFQLLITILIFFVSAWAYLNGVICDFTDSDPIDLQMSYIFVHYVLTVIIVFSVVLSALKSICILNDNSPKSIQDWFKLYLDTWFWILLICLIIIMFPKAFPLEWFFFLCIICTFVGFKMYDLKFSKISKIVSIPILIIGFPLFLSIMTSTIVNVEAKTDKSFYSYSDKVKITVSARGYACEHKFVGLGEEIGFPKNYSDKGLIVINAYQIKNNRVSIGTVSPATGILNFICYFCNKNIGIEPSYTKDKKNAHYTPISIYVEPK